MINKIIKVERFKNTIFNLFNMEGRDTVVEYESQDGERIKVVCGPVVRKGGITCFKRVTARIYVNKTLEREYFFRHQDMNMDMIPEMNYRLEELADGGACSEEIISAIDTIISNQNEYDEARIDNGEETMSARRKTEIASTIHQICFAGDNKFLCNYLHT